MDIISFNEAATANGRIEIINANPDSTSGIVTVPKTIASGETVTVPAGRVAVLPNVVVEGDLVVEAGGEIFVPAGANFSDLEGQIATKQSKSELAYDVDTSSYIPNTLASGAIIERGSNANGEYVKYSDGTLVCKGVRTISFSNASNNGIVVTFPATFINNQYSFTHSAEDSDLGSFYYFYPAVPVGPNAVKTASQINIFLFNTTVANITVNVSCNFMAIGRWK